MLKQQTDIWLGFSGATLSASLNVIGWVPAFIAGLLTMLVMYHRYRRERRKDEMEAEEHQRKRKPKTELMRSTVDGFNRDTPTKPLP